MQQLTVLKSERRTDMISATVVYLTTDGDVDTSNVLKWEVCHSIAGFLRILAISIHNKLHIAGNGWMCTGYVQRTTICAIGSMYCKRAKHFYHKVEGNDDGLDNPF